MKDICPQPKLMFIFHFINSFIMLQSYAGQLTVSSDLNTNAVIYINQSTCPTGWSSFDQGSGRFILGSGSENLDSLGNLLTTRSYLDTGGREYTTAIPASTAIGSVEIPSPTSYFADDAPDETYSDISNVDSSLGGTLVDSNMPPYLVLKLCKKN